MQVLLTLAKKTLSRCFQSIHNKFIEVTKPTGSSRLTATLKDVFRPRSLLLAENALLRQQLIVLERQVKRPAFKRRDKFLLVVLASLVKSWREALLILQPDTLLRWHRQGFKLLWTIKSKAKKRKPRIDPQTIALIKQMAQENPLWGAERIRGELLKLQIKVSKRTIRRYMKQVRPTRPSNQNWKTFLHNHAKDIWACDFLPVVDLFFGHLYAFFIVELSSRRVVHFGVTRHPTDEWSAQQLREATGFGEQPKYLIRDNDRKFGRAFERVAQDSGIEILKTPIRAPKANAICERFCGSVRRELLDHLFILIERQLYRVLKDYVDYFNRARPHQGIAQRLPVPPNEYWPVAEGKIVSKKRVGGLHHSYQRVA